MEAKPLVKEDVSDIALTGVGEPLHCVQVHDVLAAVEWFKKDLQKLIDMSEHITHINDLSKAKVSGEVNAFMTAIRKIDEAFDIRKGEGGG